MSRTPNETPAKHKAFKEFFYFLLGMTEAQYNTSLTHKARGLQAHSAGRRT